MAIIDSGCESVSDSAGQGGFYRALWRWHFYAGLYVIPVLLVLSLSGILMLASKPLDHLFLRQLLSVKPEGEVLSPSEQLALVKTAFPGSSVQLWIPPRVDTESARFFLVPHAAAGHGGHNMPGSMVYLNPYTGKILGETDPAHSFYSRIKSFHGSLMLGDAGDSLIEIAAGFAVLMVISGLYLAWPKNWRALLPRPVLSDRADWRQFHGFVGMLVAIPLLFFLISGLAWTNVWGGKLTQAWSSLPGTSFEAPLAQASHQDLNQNGVHQVPWVLEQTSLPQSKPGLGELDLDRVSRIAREQGFSNYRVHLPRSDQSVWTISATTIAGDVKNPAAERTLHLDRHTGRVLADVRYQDYPAMGKAMAASVPFHQGDLGVWNLVLNLIFCFMVVVMIVSGVTLWWKRRPSRQRKLAPPAAPVRATRVVVAMMCLVALCFPLSAAVMVVIAGLDWMFFSRVKWMRAAVK